MNLGILSPRPARRTFWLAGAAMAAALSATPALAQEARAYDIPAQSASEGIRTLARDSGLQVIAPSEDVAGVRTNAVRGDYEPVAALRAMLAGTGLQVVETGPGTVTVRRAAGAVVAGSEDTELSGVEVTGSRIERAGFDTLQAATVVTGETIERRGYTNVLDALQDTPGFGAPGNSPLQTSQGFQSLGQSFANFFGLGSQRTLTLVNGRRFVSGNTVSGSQNSGQLGAQVDLNSIPTGLVERVETVAIGGAPVYGSDAIAGTVNIILKDDFEGLEASAQYGNTEEGDVQSYNLRVLMGGNFADGRGNATLSAEYTETEGLIFDDRLRTFGRSIPSGNTNPSDGISSTMYVPDLRYAGVNEGGVPIRVGTALGYLTNAAGQPLQFDANGELVPFDVGGSFFNSAARGQQIGGDGLNTGRLTSLLTGSQRYMLNANARYDLSDQVRAFIEASYANSWADGEAAGGLFQAAASVLGGPNIVVQASNPFLSDATRAILAANGVTSFRLNRTLHDVNERKPATNEVETYRFVGGFMGEVEVFGRPWKWDIAYNYGRSQGRTGVNVIDPTRFAAALDVTRNAAGEIVCVSGGTCVPLNLFGYDRFSDAAAAYVVDRGQGVSTNTQSVVTANIAGHLPFGIADDIAFNVGAERRHESGEFVADATLKRGIAILLGAGSGAATAAADVEGDFTTHEVYGETIVPLVTDEWNWPVVKSAQFEGAIRYVDHSLTGGDITWSAGGRIEPRLPGWGDGLTVRGVFTHAIRSPAVTELFLGTVGIASQGNDVCSAVAYNTGTNPAVRAANCTAALAALGAGAPQNFVPTTNVNSVLGTRSGNQDLENETADSWSIGLVYQPTALPGFRASLDYSRIAIDDVISNLSFGQLQAACYDSASFPNEPACDTFRRMTAEEAAASRAAGVNRVTGDLANGFQSGFVNAASRRFRGWLGSAEYRFEVGDLVSAWQDAGALRLRLSAFYLERDNSVTLPGTPVSKSAGLYGSPRWTLNGTVGYSWNRWDIDVQTNWVSETLVSRVLTLEQTPFLKFPSATRVNATIGYQVLDNLRAQLAVTNLFDADVPYEAEALGAIGVHDPIGRRYTFRLTATF